VSDEAGSSLVFCLYLNCWLNVILLKFCQSSKLLGSAVQPNGFENLISIINCKILNQDGIENTDSDLAVIHLFIGGNHVVDPVLRDVQSQNGGLPAPNIPDPTRLFGRPVSHQILVIQAFLKAVRGNIKKIEKIQSLLNTCFIPDKYLYSN
jgi:hypothetical protein